jgi:hypothetical protein
MQGARRKRQVLDNIKRDERADNGVCIDLQVIMRNPMISDQVSLSQYR